jgi:hypothetical protein
MGMSIEENKKNTLDEETLKPKTEVVFEEIIKLPEIQEALDILNSLPENLKYHDKNHTLDVIKETILFCLADNVGEDVLKQQCISAAWHDVGYIERYNENEPIAVELFRRSNTYKELDEETKNEIEANILDTQMVMIDGVPHILQKRSTSAYVLDADVGNFGRKDYWEKRLKVAEELNLDLNDPKINKLFIKFAIDLMLNHEWKTESARKLRETQKIINLEILKEVLSKI